MHCSIKNKKPVHRAATAIDTGDWTMVKDEDETVEFVPAMTKRRPLHTLSKYRKVTAKGKEQYQLGVG
jgi:alanyl-tRNA synthetase